MTDEDTPEDRPARPGERAIQRRAELPEPRDESWSTTGRDELAGAALGDVLRQASRTASRVDDDERAQIAVRLAPPGFRAITGQLAHEYRVSYSRFIRYALDTGVDLLDADESIIRLREAFRVTSSDAMSRGDQDALTRLNQVTAYEFQRSQEFRTTLVVSRVTAARLGDLAMVCGIPPSRLGVVTALVALLTLPNNRDYRNALSAEVDAFHRYVVLRTRVLLLGDGTGSRRSDARGRLR